MRIVRARRGLQQTAALAALLLVLGCVAAGPPKGPIDLASAAELAEPGTPRASIHLVARAERAMEQGALGRARELASRAVRIDGQNPYAYLLLGEVAGASGEHETALRYLQQAGLLFRGTDPLNEVWLARTLRLEACLLEQLDRAGEARRLRDEADALDRGGPALEGRPPL